MALNAYLTIKGAKQGEIKGSVTQKGREGKIMVIAVSHDVMSPRDAATGLPAGKRVHTPFIITKQLDRSSPLLYSALAAHENLTTWELQFWAPGPSGVEKQDYTITLTNASITSIKFRMDNNKHPDTASLAEYEDIGFVYQRIEWVWTDGAISAADDWFSTP
jgi:type VI secretion system secreted protein Hcp